MHNPVNKEDLLYMSDMLMPEILILITVYYVFQWAQ
jgi:hypothetical protein